MKYIVTFAAVLFTFTVQADPKGKGLCPQFSQSELKPFHESSVLYVNDARIRMPVKAEHLYEVKAAEHYISSRKGTGEKIVLASKILLWDVPGYDAVVINGLGEKVANVSIKGLRVATDSDRYGILENKIASKIVKMVRAATYSARKYSRENAWDYYFKYTRAQLDRLVIQDPILKDRREFLDLAMNFYSVPFDVNHVRSRIVVIISNAEGDLMELDQSHVRSEQILKILTKRGESIESVTIVAKNQVWDIKNPLNVVP